MYSKTLYETERIAANSRIIIITRLNLNAIPLKRCKKKIL